MVVNLAQITFDNNRYELELSDGNTLILYDTDESIQNDLGGTSVECVLIVTQDADGNQTLHSSVIGMADSYVSLLTDYTDWQGKVLVKGNMEYCTIEVQDE